MGTYIYRLDLIVDGVKQERTGQIEADSLDAAAVELRKTPGYVGSSLQSAEAKRPLISPSSTRPVSLGWIDPMFKDF